MLKKSIQNYICPKCDQQEVKWQVEEYQSTDRILNGMITCDNNHSWVIKHGVLRFDKESDDSEPQFRDNDITGFPSKNMVEESERGKFLDDFENFISITDNLNEFNNLSGDSILLLSHLEFKNDELNLINEDEPILRQLQEISVRRRIYDQTNLIRASESNFVKSNTLEIEFSDISNKKSSNSQIGFVKSVGDGDKVIFEGNQFLLVYRN